RAKAQNKAGLLMGQESPASRCEVHARQMLIYERIVSPQEITEEIDRVTPERVVSLAKRLFEGAVPTIAALGPVKNLETYDRLAARFNG
ncbi:hypothetical protein, partial [Brevundimonas denitrificans]